MGANIHPVGQTISYFLLSGLFEISGGYLIWLWLRERRGMLFGLIGAVVVLIGTAVIMYARR